MGCISFSLDSRNISKHHQRSEALCVHFDQMAECSMQFQLYQENIHISKNTFFSMTGEAMLIIKVQLNIEIC